MDINKIYLNILESELTKRLGREPFDHELTNADNDSDLVNEVLWQIIYSFNDRLAALEKKSGLQTPTNVTTPPDGDV